VVAQVAFARLQPNTSGTHLRDRPRGSETPLVFSQLSQSQRRLRTLLRERRNIQTYADPELRLAGEEAFQNRLQAILLQVPLGDVLRDLLSFSHGATVNMTRANSPRGREKGARVGGGASTVLACARRW